MKYALVLVAALAALAHAAHPSPPTEPGRTKPLTRSDGNIKTIPSSPSLLRQALMSSGSKLQRAGSGTAVRGGKHPPPIDTSTVFEPMNSPGRSSDSETEDPETEKLLLAERAASMARLRGGKLIPPGLKHKKRFDTVVLAPSKNQGRLQRRQDGERAGETLLRYPSHGFGVDRKRPRPSMGALAPAQSTKRHTSIGHTQAPPALTIHDVNLRVPTTLGRWFIDTRMGENYLGRGSFGHVWRAVEVGHRADHDLDHEVAVKLVSKPLMVKYTRMFAHEPLMSEAEALRRARKVLWREFSLQRAAAQGCKYIAPVVEWSEALPNYWAIISKVANSYDVQMAIEEPAVLVFDDVDRARMMREMVLAVVHLHSIGIIQRDIKPDNFLLRDAPHRPIVWLTDFGRACRVGDAACLAEFAATWGYTSPDMFVAYAGLQGENINSNAWDAFKALWTAHGGVQLWSHAIPRNWVANDIYMLGASLYDFFYGRQPNANRFPEPRPVPAVDSTTGKTLSPACTDMLRAMLQLDPSRRIQAHELPGHACMREWHEAVRVAKAAARARVAAYKAQQATASSSSAAGSSNAGVM